MRVDHITHATYNNASNALYTSPNFAAKGGSTRPVRPSDVCTGLDKRVIRLFRDCRYSLRRTLRRCRGTISWRQ